MTPEEKRIAVVKAVEELDAKMLDATLKSIRRHIIKSGNELSTTRVNSVVRELVDDGVLKESERRQGRSAARFFIV